MFSASIRDHTHQVEGLLHAGGVVLVPRLPGASEAAGAEPAGVEGVAMDFDRMRVAIGMEVVGSDLLPLGDVIRIVPPTLVVVHPWYRELAVPFDAITDISGNVIVVALPAQHIVATIWRPAGNRGPA